MWGGHLSYPLRGFKKEKRAECSMVLFLGLIYLSFQLPNAPRGRSHRCGAPPFPGPPTPSLPLPRPPPSPRLANRLGWKIAPCPSSGPTVRPLLSASAGLFLLIPVLLKCRSWFFCERLGSNPITSHVARPFPTCSLPTCYHLSQSPRGYLYCGLQTPPTCPLQGGWCFWGALMSSPGLLREG